jgi:riboflavin biosynthesis pyrimidine reductase
VLQAIVAIVHFLQSMIMGINVKAGTDRLLKRIIEP